MSKDNTLLIGVAAVVAIGLIAGFGFVSRVQPTEPTEPVVVNVNIPDSYYPNTSDDSLGGTIYNRIITFSKGIDLEGRFVVDTDTLYLDATNNRIGLGTTTPDKMLHLSGGEIMIDDNDDATNKGCIKFVNASTELQWSNDCSSYQSFAASTTAAGWTDDGTSIRLTTITDKVGIGTTTPDAGLHLGTTVSTHSVSAVADAIISGKLEVDGAVFFDGAVTGASTLTLTSHLIVDTSTLYVDATNNKVGIGTTTPDMGLHLGASPSTHTVTNANDLLVSGIAEVDGWAYLDATLTVAGTSTFTGAALFSATSTLSSGLIVDTNTLYVDQENNKIGVGTTSPDAGLHVGTKVSTHSVSAAADLLVSGKIEVDGVAWFDGNTTLAGTLTVAGESQLENLVYGGAVYSTTTVLHITMTAAQFCDNSVFTVIPGATTTINVTLPSTTTLAADCLDTAGDTKSLIFENGATAATTTAIVAGTGITLLSDDSAGDQIGQNGWAEIQITRKNDTEFPAVIRPFTDSD